MTLTVVRFSIFWILYFYSNFISATAVVVQLLASGEEDKEHPQLRRRRHLRNREFRFISVFGLFDGDWALIVGVIIALLLSFRYFRIQRRLKADQAKEKLEKRNEVVNQMEEAMLNWIQNDIIMQEENITPTREIKEKEVKDFRSVATKVKEFADRSFHISGLTVPDRRSDFICSMDEEARETYQVFCKFVQDCLQQRGINDNDDEGLWEYLESITKIFDALHQRNERRFEAMKKGRVERALPLETRGTIERKASQELAIDNIRSKKLAAILSMTTTQMDEADVKSKQQGRPLVTAVVTKFLQDQDCGIRVSQLADQPIKISFINRKYDGMFAQSDLKIGMEIVSINGVSMQYKTAKEFTKLLEEAVGTVTIVAKTVLP